MSHRGPTNHGERDYLRLGTSAFCYSHIWKFFYHMDLVIIRKHYFHWFSSIWYAAGMVRMWWLKLSLVFFPSGTVQIEMVTEYQWVKK